MSSSNSPSTSVQFTVGAAPSRDRYSDMDQNPEDYPLEPPKPPFRSRASSVASNNANTAVSSDAKEIPPSLSVNYLPSKFSNTMLSGGPKRRKFWKSTEIALPKRGGGREAFRKNEPRMPGDGDEDYDGVTFSPREGGRTRQKLRWNRFKWTLFVSNIIFTAYSIAGLVSCILIWLNVWAHADIIRVGNRPELVTSTLASVLGVFTALIGWSGILLNSRSFLSVYCALLWVCFALLVTPGYVTYKRRTFNLEGKLNAQWSRDLGLGGRMRVQNQLHCCGYFSPFVEATVSQTCYARSTLPGCKAAYLKFQRRVLERWYTVVFSVVPAQIGAMAVSLLCSNHITYRFGKGMMPKAYRLDLNSMAVIMDNYASQLAEQYGSEVATEIIARSRSNLQLDAMPTMPYLRSSSTFSANRFNSLPSRVQEGQ
ncbi:hypothetical protein AcV5_005385 [Taiwanofungus camphoratus]|nr:hypothetical protein AcV5_005385 [Antrodia cinnamomea]